MGDIKRASVSWTGEGLNFTGTLGSGFTLPMGSPTGETQGSPMELLLAGVAGCTAVDIVSTLQKMRQPIKGVRVEISGERAETHPKVYTKAALTYIVQGTGVTAASVERAINLSKEKYCSASVMFAQAGVEMSSSYRIEEG